MKLFMALIAVIICLTTGYPQTSSSTPAKVMSEAALAAQSAGSNVGATALTAVAKQQQKSKPVVVKPTVQARKKIIDLSFPFRYYQVYKPKGDFDTSQLWFNAKLQKTFENKGLIKHDLTRKSIRFRLTGEKEFEQFYLNEAKPITANYAQTISGLKYFKYTDSLLGPSVAIYFPDKKIYVLYRQNKAVDPK